jgi:hypothetical protein
MITVNLLQARKVKSIGQNSLLCGQKIIGDISNRFNIN